MKGNCAVSFGVELNFLGGCLVFDLVRSCMDFAGILLLMLAEILQHCS